MNADNEPRIPTVSHVDGDTLIELVFDAKARKTALAVCRNSQWTIQHEVRTKNGEILIPYSAANNLIRHQCVLLPTEPIDHGTKARLLADIQAYLERYVDLSPVFARISAHYALMSWVFDAFNELPYLRFRGDYGSGKTRALIALGSIVYKGFFASGASTVSPVFHTLDKFGGTLVLDEADLRFSDKTADLVKILNNGTVKGLPVLRTMQNRNREFNPAAFTVFGPKIIAMRGYFRDSALESRFLSEDMGTRPLRSDIPIQLPTSLKDEALALRNRLLHFRFTHLAQIKSDPSRLIEGLGPRLNQTALSLLSLVDDADTRADIAAMLRTAQTQLLQARERNATSRAMAAINQAFSNTGRSFVPLREITDLANRTDATLTPLTARDVGQALRSAAIPLRKSHGTIVVARSAHTPT